MRTIALINQKGGVGKTTVALHLAAAFQLHGRDTLVLDLDPQASASEWHDARENKLPHVESIQPARLAKVVEQAREIGTGVLVLDTAPHAESTALEAARCADLVLVPCQPSIMDLRAMRKTADLLKLVRVPAFAVLNSVPPQRTVADEAEEMIAGTLGLPVCPVRLGDRVAYDRCLITGQVAQEIEPAGKAAAEVARLYMWTCEQLGMPAGELVLTSAGEHVDVAAGANDRTHTHAHVGG
ncbi:ParA family partition ATPase [Methylobacterium sp. WSM2598]|uniref:ParA family partition ATPase n=1 Tax=Methylobacterium sp. WSM2598 TaxID=398261 RepID=UPI00035DFD34|nr:ParA family partition ATPase [Methylobacterium sp. WSM2598]